jgi:putative FmdB family regulatory protein
MPIFEYVCQECDHGFEALVYGDEKAQCPKCQSRNLAPQLSTFSVSTKSGTSSLPRTAACGSCGDPGGPGACGRRDFN